MNSVKVTCECLETCYSTIEALTYLATTLQFHMTFQYENPLIPHLDNRKIYIHAYYSIHRPIVHPYLRVS